MAKLAFLFCFQSKNKKKYLCCVLYTLGRWVVFSSQTHGKFTAFYRDAMGKGAPHAADSLAFQASG